jgi:hypothetical protein
MATTAARQMTMMATDCTLGWMGRVQGELGQATGRGLMPFAGSSLPHLGYFCLAMTRSLIFS